jgi:viologen exporter family transport system permease protein
VTAYVEFARRGFQRAITYRFLVWSELVVNIVFMYAYVCLWRALYVGRDAVAGYDQRALVSYIIVAQTLITLQFTVRTVWTIEAKVRSGEVALDLMRPIDFQGTLLATSLGTAAHTILFNMLPKFALFAAMGAAQPPASGAALALFAVSAPLGYLVLFGIEYLLGLTAFWLVEVRGIYMAVMWGANTLLSGYFLPIDFYPRWLAALARAGPFQSMVYSPAAIYTGRLSGTAALASVAVQAAWAVLLVTAGRVMFEIARRRLVVQGG